MWKWDTPEGRESARTIGQMLLTILFVMVALSVVDFLFGNGSPLGIWVSLLLLVALGVPIAIIYHVIPGGRAPDKASQQ